MDDANVPAPAPEPQAASASVIAERDRYQTEASSLRADLLKEREARAAAEASLTEARQALAKAQAEAQDATLRTEANNALVEGRITADEVDAYRKAAARRDAGDADWFNAQFASRKAGKPSDKVYKRKATRTKPVLSLSAFQAVRRDFAFVVDVDVPAATLVRAALGADKALISGVNVFDLFAGPSLGEDKKSVALEITIQPRERTLTDEDLDKLAKSVIANVEKSSGGVLRG